MFDRPPDRELAATIQADIRGHLAKSGRHTLPIDSLGEGGNTEKDKGMRKEKENELKTYQLRRKHGKTPSDEEGEFPSGFSSNDGGSGDIHYKESEDSEGSPSLETFVLEMDTPYMGVTQPTPQYPELPQTIGLHLERTPLMRVVGLTIKDPSWGWAMDMFMLLLLLSTPYGGVIPPWVRCPSVKVVPIINPTVDMDHSWVQFYSAKVLEVTAQLPIVQAMDWATLQAILQDTLLWINLPMEADAAEVDTAEVDATEAMEVDTAVIVPMEADTTDADMSALRWIKVQASDVPHTPHDLHPQVLDRRQAT